MNTDIKLLYPVSNTTRIRNCIEDYVASIHPFHLQIGWFMGKIDYLYPDKPEDGTTGYIAYGKDGGRVKLKTARYLTRKCGLNTHISIGDTLLNDEQIRSLAEKINNLLWTDEELNCIELISGKAITQAYSDSVGGSSCMTGGCSDYTGLYAANPTRFQMLIARNGNDSARAIVHILDNGQKILGRIYTTAQHLINTMDDYAKSNGWLNGNDLSNDQKDTAIMSGLNFDDGEIPYMDTLTQGEIIHGLLTISYSGGEYDLRNQDGSLNGNSYVCENCSERVHEDDAYSDENGDIYCEYCFNENFIWCNYQHCNSCVPVNDTVHIKDEDVKVCSVCASDHYYVCDCCGDHYTLDGLQFIVDDAYYCSSCFDEHANCCSDCGETFFNDDLITVDDELFCCVCANQAQEAKKEAV